MLNVTCRFSEYTKTPKYTVCKSLSILAVMVVCAVVMIAVSSIPVYAANVSLSYSDDGDDGSVPTDIPELLEYEGVQMSITRAELGTFPFLELLVNFEEGAVTQDVQLQLLLSDSVFDPIFDPSSEIEILTEVDSHDAFEISSKNLIISELSVGIESIDIYVSKQVQSDQKDSEITENNNNDNVTMPEAENKDDATTPKTKDDQTVMDDGDAKIPDEPPATIPDEPPATIPDDLSDRIDDDSIVVDTADVSSQPPTDESSSKCGAGTVLVDGVCVLESDAPSQPPTDESSSKCGAGTVLVDGVCVLESDAPSQPPTDESSSKCGAGTVLVDGVCVLESDAPSQPPTDESSSKCGAGTVLVDGVCVLESDAPSQPPTDESSSKCGAGTVLVDDICVLDSSPLEFEDGTQTMPSNSNVQMNGRDLITGVVAGFVIAGVVGVILALMYRADRTKKSQPS